MVTTGSRSLEREVKLDSDPRFQVPDLRGVVARVVQKPAQELRTAYFDTADLLLWERGLSLRHRLGEEPGGGGTWTIKLPTQSGSDDGSKRTLDRTEMSWSGSREAVPLQATSLLVGITRGASLGPVTELVTTRRRFALHNANDTARGELDDDVVSVVGGPRDGLQFRQLEVELGAGGAFLDGVLDELRRAGAQVSAEPKLAKALGRRAGPGATAASRLKHRDRLRKVIKASITDALGLILDHDYLLRADPSDPPAHSIHQARVATRRLGSDLKTFRSVLDPVWLDQTRAELKWLGGILGDVRDPDVLAGHLEEGNGKQKDGPTGSGDDGVAELQARLARQRQEALGKLSAALSGPRYLGLLDELEEAIHRLPTARSLSGGSDIERRAAVLLPGLVGRQWKVLRRRVRRAGDDPSDDQLHRIRIAAKQLRYAAEMAAPVMGRKARRTAKAAESLQTILGQHHDSVAAERWLGETALLSTPAAAYRAGRLSVDQQRLQQRLRRRWRSVGGDLDRKKKRGWLR